MNLHHRSQLFAMAMLLAFIAAACSSDDNGPTGPSDPAVTETIGSAGGTIGIAEEISLNIPSGALNSDVTFTMGNAGSNHTPMVQTRDLMSSVYRIGPAGTVFSEPVPLTLYYDDDDLGEVDPSTLIIYTDRGEGWIPLPTTHDKAIAGLTAHVIRLSDFAITAPVEEPAEGVYAALEIVRLINYAYTPPDEDMYDDMITAYFDSTVGGLNRLQPGSVVCNGDSLVWDGLFRMYINAEDEVLVPGASYRYEVTASDEVPFPLDETITMVDANPTIRIPGELDPVSLSGFSIQWDGTSAGSVTLSLVSGEMEFFSVEAPNSGTYTFTEQQLSGLDPGTYFLTLTYTNIRSLTGVTGYDPRSHISASTISGKLISLVDTPGLIGPDGGVLLLGNDGRMHVSAGALSETIAFTAAVNNAPPAVPDGYILLTPVYRVSPSGTTFAIPSTVEFRYNPADLGGSSEESIVILRHDGTDWAVLDSDVDIYDRLVTTEISSLSDFVAAVPTSGEGIYAVVDIWRTKTSMFGFDTTADVISARFDTSVGETAVDPLQAGGVSFGAWTMLWNDEAYSYFDFENTAFLTIGADYQYIVMPSDDVPAIDMTITMPASEVAITNLGDEPELSLSGFTLNWSGSDLGSTVGIIVLAYGHFGGLDLDVPNTGSYTFSASELSVLETGMGTIQMSWTRSTPIAVDGYHALSHVGNTFVHNYTVTFVE